MTEQEIHNLASTMEAGDVVIYTERGCAYCDMAKQWLDKNGFKYTECDIESDSRCAAVFKQYRPIGTPYVVVKRSGQERHLRDGFTSAAFLAALIT